MSSLHEKYWLSDEDSRFLRDNKRYSLRNPDMFVSKNHHPVNNYDRFGHNEL
jgi:hypothetical protein